MAETKPFTPWALKNFGRVDFKTNEFDKEIYQKGARMVWQKSILCSCLDPVTGQPDFSCPACGGKGFLFFDPKEIRGVVSGMSDPRQYIPIGLLDVGTAYLTTMTTDNVGFRDRITFLDFVTPYSQVLTYTSDPKGVKLKYQVVDITAVMILNQQLDPSQYTLSADNQHLTFDPSLGLRDGDRLSILCHINPVYIVIDMPHELRGTFVKFGYPDETWQLLPKQFLIKREDLLPLQRGQVLPPQGN